MAARERVPLPKQLRDTGVADTKGGKCYETKETIAIKTEKETTVATKINKKNKKNTGNKDRK